MQAAVRAELLRRNRLSGVYGNEKQYRKENKVFFYQYVQSFKPDCGATPQEIHQMGIELARRFEGYEVQIATHIDRDHWHNHLIVNSVSCETGLKLQFNEKDLEQLRTLSDKICLAHGLEILKPYQKPAMKPMGAGEYRSAVRGGSFKFQLMNAIDTALSQSRTQAEFTACMEEMGYGVKWIPHHKYITYTAPTGQRCRDNKLHDEKYLKERMEQHFAELERTQGFEQAAGDTAEADHALSAAGQRHSDRGMGCYRRQGFGFRKIARLLNEEHILPPRDYYYEQKGAESKGYRNHLWNDVTVKSMLRSEVYIGHMVQNKRGTLSYKNKKQVDKPKEDWIKVENTHEPIIDMDTWKACAEVDARNYKPRPTKENEISLFGGLLKCMDCGFKMRYSQETHTYPKRGKVKYISYFCGSYARSGRSACSAHIIYLNPLSELVLGDIRHRAKRVLEDEDRVRRELLEQKASQSDRQLKADKSTLRATEKRLAELEKLTQALYEDKVLGTVPEAVFKNLLTKYEAERVEKQSLVQKLKKRLADTVQDERDIEQYIQSIKKYVSVEQLDRGMLLELIKYIEIGERKVVDGQKCRDIVIHYNLVDKAG